MGVLWFDGLLTQVRDAGVYFLPEDDLDELREAAAVNEFRCVRADLAGCDRADVLRAAVAGALHLPDWAVRDGDALAGALAAPHAHDTRGLVLVLENSAQVRRDLRDEFKALAESLQAASGQWAARGAPFWAFIALPEGEFAALD